MQLQAGTISFSKMWPIYWIYLYYMLCYCVIFVQAQDDFKYNQIAGNETGKTGSSVERSPHEYDSRSYSILDNGKAEPAIAHSQNGDHTSACHLHTLNSELSEKVRTLKNQNFKLIKYKLTFPDYDANPMTTNMTWNYQSDVWHRVFNKHGETLLTLAFHYDALSLLMLTFGVEELSVPLVDTPHHCFRHQSEEFKIKTARDLLMKDFVVHSNEDIFMAEEDHVCHQIIKNNDGVAEFTHECCNWLEKNGGELDCSEKEQQVYITVLYGLVITMKVGFLLFGPVFLQKCIYKESIRKTDYIIKLKDVLNKTLLVKRVYAEDEKHMPNLREKRKMKQFRKLRGFVKTVPSDKIVPVTFKKMRLEIDHTKLMTEKNVPVGLLDFLYKYLVQCRLRQHEPFLSCCRESIMGSWSPKFLWLKLMDKSDCNLSCQKCLSWGHIFRLFGGLFLMIAIPIPYYIRVAFYFLFEESEIENRRHAVDNLHLKTCYDHNLFQYIGPAHGAVIVLYITYGCTFLFLSAISKVDGEKLDDIGRGAIQDMRGVSRLECFRLLITHMLLPFEKFGLICGIIAAAIYWPIALPVCLVVFICYCIPTLYLTGRLLIHKRPTFLKTRPIPTSPRHRYKDKSLSQGATSFETCLLLDDISPDRSTGPPSPSRLREKRKCSPSREHICSAFGSLLIGIVSVLCMYCVLIMLAESWGFAVEILVLTMMGTIVNASSAARYVMLVFWIIMYTTSCYNTSYNKYARLNRKLFAFIKEKLNDDVQSVTRYRESKQKNTAFKYFTSTELNLLADNEALFYSESEETTVIPCTSGSVQSTSNTNTYEDSIEFIHGKLHWNVSSLIFFVDRKDVPRIPKKLFKQICDLRAPGCPGPVYRSLLKATRQLLYMVIFLTFVFIVVIAFGDIYEISTTNQLLLTLASGFLPFVIRFVISPRQSDIELNTYSFDGKVRQVIRNYRHAWPVYDLPFTTLDCDGNQAGKHCGRTTSHDGGGTQHGCAAAGCPDQIPNHHESSATDPTHVDLLITIKDDCGSDAADFQNLRSEPDSTGSQASLRNSQDDSGVVTGAQRAINNPRSVSNTPQRSSQSLDIIHGAVGGRDQTAGLQAGTPKTSASNASLQSRNTPDVKRVDLVIDLAKGAVQIHSPENPTEKTDNGIPLVPISSPPSNRNSGLDSESLV